jgi:hypothetical protein
VAQQLSSSLSPVAIGLADPPASLAAEVRQFYDELRAMLEHVRPSELDTERAAVNFGVDGLGLELPHVSEADWTIHARVTRHEAVVGVDPMHEHFKWDEAGHRWPSLAVDFIAEILRGEIEIHTEYRGTTLIRTRHFRIDADEQRHELRTIGLLCPALFMVWKPLRTQAVRMRFGAQR